MTAVHCAALIQNFGGGGGEGEDCQANTWTYIFQGYGVTLFIQGANHTHTTSSPLFSPSLVTEVTHKDDQLVTHQLK